jgi:hypothetical protein
MRQTCVVAGLIVGVFLFIATGSAFLGSAAISLGIVAGLALRGTSS